MDNSQIKQFFEDSTDEEARAMYAWATTAMEIRGIIPIQGAAPKRKQRSDAGQPRTEAPAAGDQLPLSWRN